MSTCLKVHQMLKHIVLSQKNAARNMKCMEIAETEKYVINYKFLGTELRWRKIHIIIYLQV